MFFMLLLVVMLSFVSQVIGFLKGWVGVLQQSRGLARFQDDLLCIELDVKIYPCEVQCCHMGTTIRHSLPDRVKPSFVSFDIQTL